jgi:hypothetical protein
MAQIPQLSAIARIHGEMSRVGGFAIAGTIAIVDVVGTIAIKAISPKTIITKH